MSRHLLSDEEVRELTGYEKPSFQAAWCKKNLVRHYINAAGEVKIPVVALAEQPEHTLSTHQPDFSQFDAAS